jgi:hypothetical protein
MVAASETSEPSSGIPSTQRVTYEDIGEGFERGYRSVLAEVLARGLLTAICTVYYPRFPEAALRKVAVAGLTVFNGCIVRAAFAHGLPLLDLRSICTEEGDYANPIEPSARGGEKRSRGRW